MKGQITISRTTSSKTGNTIRISIEDDSSSVTFLEVLMSLEDFALALTGQGYIDCNFELQGIQNVGKIRETKTELVSLANPFRATDEERLDALKPFEVDGWTARFQDIENHHRYQKDAVSVTFSRFVDRKDE